MADARVEAAPHPVRRWRRATAQVACHGVGERGSESLTQMVREPPASIALEEALLGPALLEGVWIHADGAWGAVMCLARGACLAPRLVMNRASMVASEPGSIERSGESRLRRGRWVCVAE